VIKNILNKLAIVTFSTSVFTFGISQLKANATNLVTNSSFEAGNIPTFGYFVPAGSNLIPNWSVTQGNVNLHNSYWNSLGTGIADQSFGYNSVDLQGNGGALGAIAQVINTVAGQKYNLSFALAGNYYAFTGLDRVVEVFWSGQSLGTFTHKFNGSRTNLDWDLYNLEVTGTGSDQLKFVSLGSVTGYGAVIDNVSVEAIKTTTVPEPTALIGLIAIGAIGTGAVLKQKQV
jgi:hypothetical protein